MSKSLLIVLFALLVGGASVAQITIPTNDFQPAVGTVLQQSQANGVNETFFNTVTSGTGGGHTWDFSAIFFNAPSNGLIVDKATAPASDSFPNANVVILYDFGSDTTWNYLRSVPTSFEEHGSVLHSTFGETVTKFDPANAEYLFPMQYGDSWTLVRMIHFETTPQLYTDTYDTTFYDVDAYGTASYKGNAIPCLRVKSVKRVTVTTVANGIPINTYSTVTEMVDFAAAGFDVLATIGRSSFSGSTTYFGSGSASLYNAPTGIVELDPGQVPNGFGLDQNYPNPFNPTTTISYSLSSASKVQLKIYNALGQEIRILVDARQPTGTHRVEWDGRDSNGKLAASGLYLYRLKADSFVETRKMILIR